MNGAKRWLAIQVGYFCNDPSEKAFSPGRLNKSSLFRDALHHSGADVLVFSTHLKLKPLKKYTSIRIFALSARLVFSLRLALKLIRLSAHAELVAVYNCDFLDFLTLLPALCLFNRSCKLVVELEDLCGARYQNSRWKLPLEIFATSRLLKRSALIFTPSTKILENSLQFKKSCAGKVFPFPPALSQDFIFATENRKEPFTSFRWRLMYAGGYGSEKGTDLLIQAFKALRSDHHELHLYGGPYPADIVCMDGIYVHGLVSPKQLAYAYASADLCINPHQDIRSLQNIFPCKNIEILASGALPLMSIFCHADGMGLPNTLLFNGFDQLLYLLKNAEKLYCKYRPVLTELAYRLRSSHQSAEIIQSVSCEVRRIRKNES